MTPRLLKEESLVTWLAPSPGTELQVESLTLRLRGIAPSRREVGNELLSFRVMLVEDFSWFRDFVRSKLEQRSELQVVCEVSDGLQAVEHAAALQPDLILLDIGLPSLNGMEVARRVRELVPNSKIIFLSQEKTAILIKEAIGLGAWGYVFKSHAEGDLLPAIDAALSGRRYVSGDPERLDVALADNSATI